MKEVLRKGSTVEDDLRFVDLCAKYGIASKTFSMLGLPGETPETAELLRQFHIRNARLYPTLYDFDVTVYTPYPGTPLFDNPEKYGLRVVRPIEYTRDTVIYKARGQGDYESYTETFDTATGKTRMSAAEIVEWRDKIERDVRAAMGQAQIGRDVG